MINIILSLILGALAWLLCVVCFLDSIWAGIIPFFIVAPISMIILNRRTSKSVQAIILKSQEMMANLPKLPSEQARKNLLDKCVEEMKKAYKYKNYMLFLDKQINAQIGSIYYIQKRFKEAEPYLANVFIQQGNALAMYACILFKNKKEDEMIKAFEKAVKFSRKIPLLWNVYAWCLNEMKKRDEAIKVLNRALVDNPGDKITQDNLDLLKNSGAMKMRAYNEQWYQFWLEEPPKQIIKMDKRTMHRGR